jgi:hypothetical protein
MKEYFGVDFYVITFLLRAAWSTVLVALSITGFSVIATNDIDHSAFEFSYFLIVFLIELS